MATDNANASARIPLAFVAAGDDVLLSELGDGIDAVQREQLTAYGLSTGRRVRVIQQRPMTVILADEVELALEHGVARKIWVEPAATAAA
jgi:Fe2+ transport system protein FeoA